MSDTKSKLLEALDLTMDSLSEGRLIDILLDAYNEKKKRIEELKTENAKERDDLRRATDNIMAERHKMRTDPLYCASGQYWFALDNRLLGLYVQGSKLELIEDRAGINYLYQQISPEEARRKSKAASQ